jgi:hypothetical protein
MTCATVVGEVSLVFLCHRAQVLISSWSGGLSRLVTEGRGLRVVVAGKFECHLACVLFDYLRYYLFKV